MTSNFTKVSVVLLIFAILVIWTHGFYNQKLGCLNPANTLFAQKFDPSDIITIKASKPLGLSLEEFEENSNSGVYISEIKDGSAKLSGFSCVISLSVDICIYVQYFKIDQHFYVVMLPFYHFHYFKTGSRSRKKRALPSFGKWKGCSIFRF